MNCVTECDSTSTIPVNDPMFGNRLICRPLQYYVDVDSDSIVELGTRDHPYKDLKSVFVEVLNLHTNTDRHVNVHVKENTINYMYTEHNYIISVANLTLTTYSDESNIAGKATVMAYDTDQTQAVYTMPTKFNVMVNSDLYIDTKITDIVDADDLPTVTQGDVLIMVYKSSITFENIDFKSDYTSIDTNIVCIKAEQIREYTVVMSNMDFSVSGTVFHSRDPPSIYLTDISVDFYRNQIGFRMADLCDYPNPDQFGILSITNLTLYYSQERADVILGFYPVTYRGYGDVIINGFTSKIYNLASTSRAVLGMTELSGCTYTSTTTRYVNITDMTMFIENGYDNDPTSILSGFFIVVRDGRNYRQTQIHFRNYVAHGLSPVSLGPFRTKLGSLVDLYIYDSHFYNITSQLEMLLSEDPNSIYLDNVTFSDCQIDTLMAVEIVRTSNVTLNNVSINNFTVTNSETNGVFTVGLTEQASVTINQLTISGSVFTNAGGVIELAGSGTGTMSISNVNFDDIILSNDVSIIELQGFSTLSMSNITINNIRDLEANDDTNTIINLRSIYSTENSSISLSNTFVTYSSISLFRISNFAQTTTIDQQVSITNMTVQHCLFEFSDDILHSGFVQSDGVFSFEFDQLFFNNITFERGGNLLYLQHQSNEQMIIKNSTFTNITYSGIKIGSFDTSYDTGTKVLVID